MAAGDQALVEQSTVPVLSKPADAASKPYTRPALFLRPRAGALDDDGNGAAAPPPPPPPAAAPPGDPGPAPARPRGIEAEFRGWARVPRLWPQWVERLRARHEPLWRDAGILQGILASTCRVRRGGHHGRALLQLAAFWSGATGTFVFPWGEATVTLEDVAALAGLPLLGGPVRKHVSDHDLEKDVAAIEAVRAVLNRSKKKKACQSAWVKRFVERAPEEGDGDGDGEARELLEHGAFLSLWLSLFVLPGPPFDVVRREVLPLAARLARGQTVALAPAVLASIYHDLSALKHHMASGKKTEPFVVSAPMHILQLWVWEHFTQLRPEPAVAVGASSAPRAARWHEVEKKLSSKYVHAVFMSPKEFVWRPYGNRSFFELQPELVGFRVRGQDIAASKSLFSFARCLHACELVGMNCIQKYSPHRVARQLGFDQDIPGTVPRASPGWEKAWETYNIEAKSSEFIFPNHKPCVTVRYAKWWEPYSSACSTAIADAAKMKEGNDFVGPEKRKMEGVLAGNSSKKLRVATATQGRPRNTPPGINIYTSQSVGSHAAIKRPVAAPGAPRLVLRACPPHLIRFNRAVSATQMPQPAPHADPLDLISLSQRLSKKPKQPNTECADPLDHISLSQRLSNITKNKKPKQPNTECLVKGGKRERTVKSLKIFITKSPIVDPKKAVLHKVIEKAFPDAVASSPIRVDESSCGFVTERTLAKCLEQSKAEDLSTANGENNSRTEHCDVVLLNVVQGAVSTGRGEAIGAGTDVDMLPTHADFLVISDDDECDKSSSNGHEVSATHLKSHMSEAKMSLIRERNEDSKLVDARNDEQDSQVLKKVTTQGNSCEIVEISNDEEMSKEAGVFDDVTGKEDALDTMHLKSHKTEATQTNLQKCNEEKKIVSETNDELDNLVMKEGTVQNSCDCQLASVQDDTNLRLQPESLTYAATVQTSDALLQGATEEMDTCAVTGDINNADKVRNKNGGPLNFSEKGNEDVLVSNKELELPMEHSAGVSRKKSGNSEGVSNMLLDGNTKLVSQEVCTKTLYYLSRFDLMEDAWDKDANSSDKDDDFYPPRRAVGTIEMIKKASAIRQAEMAELKKKIDTLKEEIRALEANGKGKPP